VQAVRAPWATSSFLLYAGGIAIVLSVIGLLDTTAGHHSKAAFVAWSLLVLVVLDGLAFALLFAKQRLAAGLIVTSGVIALAVFVGALFNWFGWLADTDNAFEGFHVGNMVVVACLIGDAIFSLRVFRFPLLMLLLCGGTWYLVTDILSSGGNWSATVTVAFGVVLMLAGLVADRVYGFWVHVVAGLTIGGGLLYFWHSSDTDWILIALASLVYVVLAAALERSSYAVLAAIGLLLTTSHFVEKWWGLVVLPFFSDEDTPNNPWARALAYAVYGALLMVLGTFVARRRVPPPAVPPV
jgi:hypothetical protein